MTGKDSLFTGMPKVAVLLPTLNECQTVEEAVRNVLAQQDELFEFDLCVVVVDSNSTDGTPEIARRLAKEHPSVHLLPVGERGLGTALIAGYDNAFNDLAADVAVVMDADLSHNAAYLPAMLDSIARGYDLVIGSRYIEGGGSRNWPFSRRLLSRCANLYIRFITGNWHVHEWTSGYRSITADLYRRLDFTIIGWRDYTLVPALVYEALCKGANLREVPITFVNRDAGRSKLPAIGYTLHLLRHFLRVSASQRLHRGTDLLSHLPSGRAGTFDASGGQGVDGRRSSTPNR